MVEPLTLGQKLFNQRLLAEHCITEDRARHLWEEIGSNGADMGSDRFETSIAQANEQLQYIGLEISAVSLKRDGEPKPVRYYAMINLHNDDVARKSFAAVMHSSQYAFCKLVLEKLVEGPQTRSTLINLRNDLEDPHKIALDPMEKALEQLLAERWVVEEKKKIALGARAYLELAYMLTEDFGMDKEELPQQIYHRL